MNCDFDLHTFPSPGRGLRALVPAFGPGPGGPGDLAHHHGGRPGPRRGSLPEFPARDLRGCNFERILPWFSISGIDVHYHVGVDGISLLLVELTLLLGPVVVLSSWSAVKDRVKEYHVFMLMLQTGMLGAFLALDLFLFYVFWEAHAGAHVFPDRGLGRPAPDLRRHQVLPLHHGRLGAHAGGHHLPGLLPCRRRPEPKAPTSRLDLIT